MLRLLHSSYNKSNIQTQHSNYSSLDWNWRRRQRQPTPVLLPGKSHGRRSLEGCSPWGRTESGTTDFTFTFHFHALEREMATHSSVLACRIPGTEEPSGLPFMGSHRVRHDRSDLAVVAAADWNWCWSWNSNTLTTWCEGKDQWVILEKTRC